MTEERPTTRELDFRKGLSWTRLLSTFLVALDPSKLLIAAIGVLSTALGWWFISLMFFSLWSEPKKEDYTLPDEAKVEDKASKEREFETDVKRYAFMTALAGEDGLYRVMPWTEDRGPHPFTLVTSAVGDSSETRRDLISDFTTHSVPTLIEPLRKFLSPILKLFDPVGNFWTRIYLITLLVWFLAVWAFVGGVITRLAILQLAGKDGGGLRDAIGYVASRYFAYFLSPIMPLILIMVIVICDLVFGAIHLIPGIGDLWDGLLWWLPLAGGFVMALLLIGLAGYPLMYATLSAEGSDTFDALSRSYNYVYEKPWNFLWYSAVSIVYGVVVVYFVVIVSSSTIYLSKWGVNQTPGTQYFNRTTEYLFIYTPKSYHWRDLLVKGTPAEITVGYNAPTSEKLKEGYDKAFPVLKSEHDRYISELAWNRHAGAGMVAFWVTLIFLIMLGFSYSYYWTAAAMIYLLMRQKVDATEIDEVYVEEEEADLPVTLPKTPEPTPSHVQMVDPPTVKAASKSSQDLKATTPWIAPEDAEPAATTPPVEKKETPEPGNEPPKTES
jgi:hypothetical protein